MGEGLELVATVDPEMMSRLENLEERVKALEEAASASVSAAAAVSGRRTVVVASATAPEGSAGMDAALASLSIEQRIAVKAGLLRAGLM